MVTMSQRGSVRRSCASTARGQGSRCGTRRGGTHAHAQYRKARNSGPQVSMLNICAMLSDCTLEVRPSSSLPIHDCGGDARCPWPEAAAVHGMLHTIDTGTQQVAGLIRGQGGSRLRREHHGTLNHQGLGRHRGSKRQRGPKRGRGQGSGPGEPREATRSSSSSGWGGIFSQSVAAGIHSRSAGSARANKAAFHRNPHTKERRWPKTNWW
jgi:hypothetical protein